VGFDARQLLQIQDFVQLVNAEESAEDIAKMRSIHAKAVRAAKVRHLCSLVWQAGLGVDCLTTIRAAPRLEEALLKLVNSKKPSELCEFEFARAPAEDVAALRNIYADAQLTVLLGHAKLERQWLSAIPDHPSLKSELARLLAQFTVSPSNVGRHADKLRSIHQALASARCEAETQRLCGLARRCQFKPSAETCAETTDDVQALGWSRLSLNDPFSHKRLEAPARTVHCRHRECFCLRAYVQAPFRQCPMVGCDQTVSEGCLVIDEWLCGVLDEVPGDAVEFHTATGEYRRPRQRTVLGKRKACKPLDATAAEAGSAAAPIDVD
jgi:hypothetical protein